MDPFPAGSHGQAIKTTDLLGCVSLAKRGRFAEALANLRRLQISSKEPTYSTYQLLIADSFQRTGQNEEAKNIVKRLLESPNASEVVLARSHLILGNVAKDRGESSLATDHFRRALARADSAKDAELVCWAQLRLMASTADLGGVSAGMTLLSETKRCLTRFGELRPFIALHLWIVEAESKNGFLDNARRHLRIAESLLDQTDDMWLRGYFAINSFGVCYYSADIQQAHKWARMAVEYSTVSGHAATRRAAYASLGHVEFSRGNIDEAEKYFRHALDYCETGSRSQIGVLDSIAQLKLFTNELQGTQDILNQLSEIAPLHRTSRTSYHESWTLQTKIQLLLRQGRLKEARAIFNNTEALTNEQDPKLSLVLKCLAVDTFLANHEFDAATELLDSILRSSNHLTPDLLAEKERIIAKTLTLCGSRRAASVHYDRAIRTFGIIGHLVGKETVRSDLKGCALSLDPVSDPTAVRQTINRVRALLEALKRPELVGHEAFHLLNELDCSEYVALVSIDKGTDFRVLVEAGAKPARLHEMIRLDDSNSAIDLGFSNGKRLRLTVVPKMDLSSRMAVTETKRIITALLEAETMRQNLTESAALWPVDDQVSDDTTVIASEPMVAIIKTIRRVAPTSLTVLLTGETGTGKEVLAKAVHRYSERSLKPFVAFNCAAVPRELVESQLFGYRRGAFSGANESFAGIIRSANGGTLFLDEVGEIALEVQPKLLRFIESGEVQSLGESQPTKTDVRLICATNSNLELAVREHRFREDLFFRMNVIRISIPPLRDRREEIPLLIQHFTRHVSDELSKLPPQITMEAMEHLILYSWPGNIRQLANEVRRFVALVDEQHVVTPELLSQEIVQTQLVEHREASSAQVSIHLDQTLFQATQQIERQMLTHALKAANGRVSVAAKSLGLSRKGLYLKRQRLGLAG